MKKFMRLGPATSFDDQLNSVPSIHIRCNDGKLSGYGNLGLAQPTSLRQSDAPGFERRPLRHASEQHIGCLVEVTSQHRVTTPVSIGTEQLTRIGVEELTTL